MRIKYINDYYDQIEQLFPEVDKKDIERILKFGWKSLYLSNSYGGDVFISDNNLWCYIGCLYNDSLKHFDKYVKKLCIKLRVIYTRKKIPWDGFYYFALTENQYNDYMSQIKPKGRKRKHFIFTKIRFYKLYEECWVYEHSLKYILKVPFISDLGFTFYKDKIKLESPELIVKRNPLKLSDILVTNNKYDILS